MLNKFFACGLVSIAMLACSSAEEEKYTSRQEAMTARTAREIEDDLRNDKIERPILDGSSVLLLNNIKGQIVSEEPEEAMIMIDQLISWSTTCTVCTTPVRNVR